MAKHASKTVVSKKRRLTGSKATKAIVSKPTPTATEDTAKYPTQAAAQEAAAAPPASRTLPGAFRLMKIALRPLMRHWKLFAGILLVYVVLNFLFVQTLSGLSVTNVKTSLDQLFQGHGAKVASATALFSYLLSTSSSTSSGGAVYQLVFLLVVSLALIRALREVYDGRTPRIRDAFYGGMFPLVPFVLTLLLVGVELVPMSIGATLYATVMNGGIAIYIFEKVIWTVVFLGFSVISLFLIASSLMALYITTQPGMTPIRALRASNKVTRGRRLQIVRKLLFLPIAIIVAVGVIIIPTILAVPSAASLVVMGLMVIALGVVHSYLFALLRSVLA